MQINKTVNDGKLVVALDGRLDTMTAPELEEAIKADLETVDSAEFDLTDLEYVSSAGLRVILSVHKVLSKKNGLVIKNINEIVSEVFEATGFSDILVIE